MNRVTMPEPLISELRRNTPTEILDPNGRLIGYFVAAPEEQAELYEWARREFTDDEIEQARREPGGLTLSEILSRLDNG